MSCESHRDEYFGNCPRCHRTNGYVNVRRSHWFICDEHKVKWKVGEGLFSSWREQTEAEWEKNAELLAGYTEVSPWHPDLSNVAIRMIDQTAAVACATCDEPTELVPGAVLCRLGDGKPICQECAGELHADDYPLLEMLKVQEQREAKRVPVDVTVFDNLPF